MSTRSRVRPVVVGVDGSEATWSAIAWAVDYAIDASAPLRVVAAYHPDALEAGPTLSGAHMNPTSRLAERTAREHAYSAAAYARSLGSPCGWRSPASPTAPHRFFSRRAERPWQS
jgi:nucleotide-binding universal stress UspA family protein